MFKLHTSKIPARVWNAIFYTEMWGTKSPWPPYPIHEGVGTSPWFEIKVLFHAVVVHVLLGKGYMCEQMDKAPPSHEVI